MTNINGKYFFYDDEISIFWNGKNEFTVYQKHEKKNRFVSDLTDNPLTPKKAEIIADEWLDEKLEEEKLRHADTF